MPRNLTASDRSALIKLASTLPAGSPERKAILSGLKKATVSRAEEALSLLAEYGIKADRDDLISDGFGQIIAELEDGRFVVTLNGYPEPFVEQELPYKRLGVRKRVRLKRPSARRS